MEQLSKSKDDQIIYQRNYSIHWLKCGYWLHQRYQQVFVSKCYQSLVQFFLQSFERGNTPSEQRISGEKCLLKGNFKHYKNGFFILKGDIGCFDYTVLTMEDLHSNRFFSTNFLLPKVTSWWTRHQIKLVFLASTTQIPSTRYLSNIFVQLSAWRFISYAVRRRIHL